MIRAWLLLLFALPAWGADFYVRNDGVAAKAAATSSASAATSMSRTTFNASSFDPGDVVYVSGLGGAFTGAFVIPSDGITLTCDPVQRPSIILPVSTIGIDTNGTYGNISCFDIYNADFRPAIWVRNSGGASEETIISDILSDHSGSISGSSTYAGIQVDDTAQRVFLTDVSVSRHRRYGIRISGAAYLVATRIRLDGNNAAGCGNLTSNVDQMHVRLNVANNAQNGYVVVQDSLATNGCGGDSSDFDIGRCSIGCYILRNKSVNPEGRAFTSVQSVGNSFTYADSNIARFTATGTAGAVRSGLRFYTSTASTFTFRAANNTIHAAPGITDVYGLAVGGSNVNQTFVAEAKNNVLNLPDAVAIHLEDKGGTPIALTSNNNLLRGTLSRNTAGAFFETVAVALATWQGLGWDANSLTTDPQFLGGTNPTTAEGFKLRPTSPLRRAGTCVYTTGCVPRDFGGRRARVPPDIGAWQRVIGD